MLRTRRLAGALLLAFVASSCAMEETARSPAPSASSPSSSSSGVVASTSTTIAPDEVSNGCGSGDWILTADLDGDGETEGVLIVETSDGQALVICDGLLATDRSFDLAYGVWYLAAVDVEPDGTDELFIGAASLDDAPGQPGVTLHLVDLGGDELGVVAGQGRGMLISPRAGAACMDLTGDGARELVDLWWGEDESGAPGVDRAVSSARPDEVAVPAQGRWFYPMDDEVRAWLGAFTCGDGSVALVRVPPPAAICEADGQSEFAEIVDLDDDGLDDLVVQGEADHGSRLSGIEHGAPSVVACLSSGEVDELAYGGMGEVFAADVGPDGSVVVWTGGTTVSASFASPVVWRDGRLDFVRLPDGSAFGLTDGFPMGPNPGESMSRFSCGDGNGDGENEFIQVTASWSDGTVAWRRDTWSLHDGRAITAWSDAGSSEAVDEDTAWVALDALAPENCAVPG